MTQCLVLTRNGNGDAWVFNDLKAARLHPIAQMDDVFAVTPEQLVDQYGKGMIDTLLRFANGRDRQRLVTAIEEWKGGGHMAPEAKRLLWDTVKAAAKRPPKDPAQTVQIIVEDRVYREGRILRSFTTEARSPAPTPQSTRKEDMATRKRVNEYDTITVITEERKNPKRAGSQAHGRFELYEDGMTVKEAKEAGVLAVDIAYDLDHDYISLTPGEAPASDEPEQAEAKPAKKKAEKKASGGGKKKAAKGEQAAA